MAELKISDMTQIVKKSEYSHNNELDNVILPESVTVIDDFAFMKSSVTSINIPSGVKRIGDGAFYDTPLNLDDGFLPSSVETIGMGAFKKTKINAVTLPDSIKEVGVSAFRSTNIQSLVVSEAMTEINDYTFADNKKLKIIRFGNGQTDKSCKGLTRIGKRAFYKTGIRSVSVFSGMISSVGTASENALKTVNKLILPDGVEVIDDEAFAECTSLTEVVLPNSLKRIGKRAFAGCKKLEMITWSEKLEAIDDQAFMGTAITTIKLPESAKVSETAFDECDITEIELSPSKDKKLTFKYNLLINHNNVIICELIKKGL